MRFALVEHLRRWREAAALWLRSHWPHQPITAQDLGRRGEQAAADYLRRLGYRVLGMAVRMRGGELDLVAFDGPTLVFVEVKTRRDVARGSPLLAIDARKRRRMTSGALAFMKRHGLLGQPARFDCVAVVWPELAREPTIEHVRHAFEAEGHGGFYS